MCQIAKQLLAEKLIDDFYDEYVHYRESQNTENLLERLKALLPTEHHEIFYRLEVEYAENGGQELRQFSEFVAGILLSGNCREEGDGGCNTPSVHR